MIRTRTLLTLATLLAAAVAGQAQDEGGQTELIWKDGRWVEVAPAEEGTPAGEAAIIRGLIDRGKHAKAVDRAEDFLKDYPESPLREQVLSLAGDAEMARGRYWKAYEWYERQLEEHPRGHRRERALARQMEIASAFLAGKKRPVLGIFRVSARQEGIDILHRVAERAEGTERAEVALLAVADHYYAEGEWSAAADAYDAFLRLHRKSPRAAAAELRAAEATYNAYQGPDFDETPLIEAEQRYKAFATRYPARAKEANVAEALRTIRQARAGKAFHVGEFYRRTREDEAAAYYYRLVRREYRGTNWAALAADRLGQLGVEDAAAPAGPPPATAPADDEEDEEKETEQ